jgi:hypothetical protein
MMLMDNIVCFIVAYLICHVTHGFYLLSFRLHGCVFGRQPCEKVNNHVSQIDY